MRSRCGRWPALMPPSHSFASSSRRCRRPAAPDASQRHGCAPMLDALDMLRLLSPADALALSAALSDGRGRPEAGDAQPSSSDRVHAPRPEAACWRAQHGPAARLQMLPSQGREACLARSVRRPARSARRKIRLGATCRDPDLRSEPTAPAGGAAHRRSPLCRAIGAQRPTGCQTWTVLCSAGSSVSLRVF